MKRRRELDILAAKLAHYLTVQGVALQSRMYRVDDRYVKLESLPNQGRVMFYFASLVEQGQAVGAYAQMAFFSDDFSQQEIHGPTEREFVPPPWARYAVCLNVMRMNERIQERK